MRTVSTRTRKKATVRFEIELMEWIVRQAKIENMSFNAYMEKIVEEKKEHIERMEGLRFPETISPEAMSLFGIITPITEEDARPK